MERAFLSLGRDALPEERHTHPGWQLVHEYPFVPELPAHAHAWQVPNHEGFIAASKGAPEAIADICGLNEAARAALLTEVGLLAKEGLRVLAVAKAELSAQCGHEQR